jgi:hypothetical protein
MFLYHFCPFSLKLKKEYAIFYLLGDRGVRGPTGEKL